MLHLTTTTLIYPLAAHLSLNHNITPHSLPLSATTKYPLPFPVHQLHTQYHNTAPHQHYFAASTFFFPFIVYHTIPQHCTTLPLHCYHYLPTSPPRSPSGCLNAMPPSPPHSISPCLPHCLLGLLSSPVLSCTLH